MFRKICARGKNFALNKLTAFWARISKEIDTDTLVYPFRYDVIMRQEFLGFYDKNKELYRKNKDSFFNLAEKEPYFRFFIGISAAHNWVKRKYGENLPQEELFRIRAEKFIELYESILKNGFTFKEKIPLKCPWKIKSPEASGRKFFLGDGCHRLAALRYIFGKQLSRKYFRRYFLYEYTLRNNTLMLARKGLLSKEEVEVVVRKGGYFLVAREAD